MLSTSAYRQALRRLLRAPGFSVVALLTLALGVGANIAVFSVVRGVLLEPLPYPEPERLVGLWHEAPALGFDLVNQGPATYFTYREQGRTFEDVGLWDEGQVTVTGLDEPKQVEAILVTDGTLPLLGTTPVIGRLFSAADDQPEAPATVILGYGYWQQEFAGDPRVLGTQLRIDGTPREIIGVLPQGCRLLDYGPQVYLPFRLDRSTALMGNFSFQGLARLEPGVNLQQANAEVARLIPLAAEAFPGGITLQMLREARFGPKVRPLMIDVVGDIGSTLWVLLGTVGIVLLIACANVANLFLVRAEARHSEVVVRQALGASRREIFWEHLVESLTLAAAGGLGGLMLAALGLRLLRVLGPEGLPRLQDIHIGAVEGWVTFGLVLASGLLLGVLPSIGRQPRELAESLRQGGLRNTSSKGRFRARSALVVGQVALALVLLVGSGLLLRSFQALHDVHPGFERPQEVLTLSLNLPEAEIEGLEEVAQTHELLALALAEIPGVTSLGLTSAVTMGGRNNSDALYFEDFPTPEGQLPPIRRFKWLAGDYFEVMGNPPLAGRSITWSDVRNRARVAVITADLAAEHWDHPAQAVGRRVRKSSEDPWREIVGVVGSVHDDGVDQSSVPVVYWPMAQESFDGEALYVYRSMVYALRLERPIGPQVLAEIQAAVHSVQSNVPVANVRTLQEILNGSLARTSFTMVMLGIAAAVALLLGFVGIFGVTSYAAAQRSREIGVRLALGAQRGNVRWLVLRQALRLAVTGAVLGLLAALALARTLQSLLFGVEAVDPLTYTVVAVLLVGVALTASYLPAWRVSRIDPIHVLRAE